MKIFIYVVIGVAGGVIGGMGMGGGTLLIPLLTIFTGLDQHIAQSVNLIAFIPMSVVAIVIHVRNKLVDFKCLLWMALPAVCASVPASLLIRKMAGESLSMYFGWFLAALGAYQLVSLIVGKIIDKKRENKKDEISLYKRVYK